MKRFVVISVLLLSLCLRPLAAIGANATTHPSPEAIVTFLNRVIDWYRLVQSLEPASGSRAQKVAELAQVSQRAAQCRAQLDELDRQLETAAPNARDAIYARRY